MTSARILTFGTFDHLHPGHIAYLTEAAALGDLCIIVARDRTVEQIKGHTPDQPEVQRQQALQEAFPDAIVQLGDPHDYLKPVRDLAPDIIVLGYDQCLPPHISEEDLPCRIVRAKPLKPDEYKSSIRRIWKE